MPFSTALPSCNPLFSNALHPASTRRRWDLRTVGTGIATDPYIVAWRQAPPSHGACPPQGEKGWALLTQRIGSSQWIASLIVVLAVSWAGYRFSALRAAASEILVEAQRLQGEKASLEGVIAAYEDGFLHRPSQMFRSGFMNGSEWVSDTTQLALAWEKPTDGVYLVVDWDCPWSRDAVDVALGVAEQGDRETILLDPRHANGPEWRGKYSLATTGLRVITPTGGWWSIGVPDGITPVWFAVATGQIVAIGVGADDLKTFAFDPAAPKSIAVSAIQLNPY